MTKTAWLSARFLIYGIAIGYIYGLQQQFDRPTTAAVTLAVPNSFLHSASRLDLNNDCAIVASEAAGRLERTGAWTRILNVHYFKARFDGQQINIGHDLVVWQPPTAKKINIYDDALLHGTMELETEAHDAGAIASELTRHIGVVIVESKFLE